MKNLGKKKKKRPDFQLVLNATVTFHSITRFSLIWPGPTYYKNREQEILSTYKEIQNYHESGKMLSRSTVDLHPWRWSEPNWAQPWAAFWNVTCCEQEVRLEEFQRSHIMPLRTQVLMLISLIKVHVAF